MSANTYLKKITLLEGINNTKNIFVEDHKQVKQTDKTGRK
jgi:FMN-dependent NADH-azoreductase